MQNHRVLSTSTRSIAVVLLLLAILTPLQGCKLDGLFQRDAIQVYSLSEVGTSGSGQAGNSGGGPIPDGEEPDGTDADELLARTLIELLFSADPGDEALYLGILKESRTGVPEQEDRPVPVPEPRVSDVSPIVVVTPTNTDPDKQELRQFFLAEESLNGRGLRKQAVESLQYSMILRNSQVLDRIAGDRRLASASTAQVASVLDLCAALLEDSVDACRSLSTRLEAQLQYSASLYRCSSELLSQLGDPSVVPVGKSDTNTQRRREVLTAQNRILTFQAEAVLLRDRLSAATDLLVAEAAKCRDYAPRFETNQLALLIRRLGMAMDGVLGADAAGSEPTLAAG